MDTRSWMAKPSIQQKKVSSLVLPGTHDSGTYALTRELSKIKYGNIAFLWDLEPGKAPDTWAGKAPYYLGDDLYNFVFSVIEDVSKAQDKSILNQLNDGIRFFDLRMYFDSATNDVHVQHGLRGCTLRTILEDVSQFLKQSGGRELILLQVSHTNFTEKSEGITKLVSELNACIEPKYVYTPKDVSSFGSTVLEQITSSGSKVVVLDADNLPYPVGSTIFSASIYQKAPGGADGTSDVEALKQREEAGLAQQRTSPFYEVAWTLTPQVTDIAREVTSRLQGNPPQGVVEAMAKKANDHLRAFVEGRNKSQAFNLITVDWYEQSSLVEIAIELTERAT
ncbi:MAG: hypothetical protein EOP06_06625 [Proteobacteria bacterium]|nr:MAG: hypothetical protein EOP06_06625 [Pseudomonadota bacterium]